MFLSINSKDRTNTSTSSNDFQIKLANPVTEIKTFEFISCIVSNTIYKIRTNVNDKLDFNDGANKSITLSQGSYTISNLCSTILTQLNTISSLFTAVSYDSITMKITISRSAAFNLLFSSGINKLTSIHKELGFNSTDLTTLLTYTSQNVVQLFNPIGMYIQINELSMPNQTTGNCFYTFHVPMAVNSDSIISVQQNNMYDQKIILTAAQTISTLTIKLKLQDANDFILNNSDFELILKLS